MVCGDANYNGLYLYNTGFHCLLNHGILYSRASSRPHSTKIHASQRPRNKDREGENQRERTGERAIELERELESAR